MILCRRSWWIFLQTWSKVREVWLRIRTKLKQPRFWNGAHQNTKSSPKDLERVKIIVQCVFQGVFFLTWNICHAGPTGQSSCLFFFDMSPMLWSRAGPRWWHWSWSSCRVPRRWSRRWIHCFRFQGARLYGGLQQPACYHQISRRLQQIH